MDDYSAVIKRKKDLDTVKNYLEFQKFMPKIKLRENLSNNPIDLIYDFLEQEGISLEQLKKEETSWNNDGKKKMSEFLETLEKYREKGEREKEFGKKLEGNVFDFGENVEKFVEKYLGQIHSIIKQRSEAEVR